MVRGTRIAVALILLLASGQARGLEETITSDKNYASHYIRNLAA